jgi:hypothetical protein
MEVLYTCKILDIIYKIIEVDEPKGGDDCKTLIFFKDDEISDIEEEMEYIFNLYKSGDIGACEYYTYTKIYDNWNKLCS